MVFRAIVIIATLLIGLGGPGCQAFAQYYPPQVYPPPRAYPTPPGPPYRPLPPVDADGDEPQRPYSVGVGVPRAGAAGSRHVDQDDPRDMAALPPEVRPETGPQKSLPPQFRRTLVDYYTKEPAGTIIVDTPNTYLYLVLGKGTALRYGIGVGREGFTWAGAERVSRMAEWPDWNPPETMIERQPYLPRFMAGGDGNPLGARALYLGQTLYRIHGTNQPSTIGTFVSSGCIRLTNEDITDLYTRVKVGTRVVVLPGKLPATAAVAPVDSPRGVMAVTPSRVTSASDLPRNRQKPEEIAAKLRQVDVLVSQGQSIADAIRQIGVTEGTYYRWRQEVGGLKRNEVKRPQDAEPKAPRVPEVSADRDNSHQTKATVETTAFEE
jgi:lipoprotein-anchoring transpeptidase ErfK/SrfK/transposase-like protein